MLTFFFFNLGSLSYTSIADFVFMWGISLTHPVLPSFLSGRDSLTHPVLASFFNLGNFYCTSCAGLFFYFLLGEFLLHIPCWVHFFFFFLSVSFSSTSRGECLLHIPCWVHFYRGCFSYTSRAGIFFYLGSFSYNPVLIFFFLGSFSYTSHVGFTFLWGEHNPCWLFFFFSIWAISLLHPVLGSFCLVSFS